MNSVYVSSDKSVSLVEIQANITPVIVTEVHDIVLRIAGAAR